MSQTMVEGYPLSPQQTRVWELQEKIGQPFYHIASFRITGHMDVELLKDSIQVVLNKHEIFQTSFTKIAGMSIPVQVIGTEAKFLFQTYTSHDSDKQDLIKQITDIEQDFSLAFELVKDGDDTFNFHVYGLELIADITTLQTIVKDILHQYYLGESTMDEDIIQYVDYSDWQEELLEIETSNEEQSQTQINHAIPYEKSKKEWVIGNKKTSIELPMEIVLHLKELKKDWHVPLEVILLSSWSAYLTKLIDGPLTIGLNMDARRNYQELQHGVGPYEKLVNFNTGEQAIECNFKDYTQNIRKQYEQLTENIEYVDPKYMKKRNNVFSYQVEYVDGLNDTFGSLSCITKDIYSFVDSFTLKLQFLYTDPTLVLGFHYNDEVFERAAIQTIAKQYMYFLEECLKNPNKTLTQLRYMSLEDEKEVIQSINRMNDGKKADLINRDTDNLLYVLDNAYKTHANKAAIVDGRDTLTYKEVDEKSTRIANYLLTHHIEPEDRIGLIMTRSKEAIISMLAILKTGASFVPIDPKWPIERIRYVLLDCESKLVLTSEMEASNPSLSEIATIIEFDSLESVIESDNYHFPLALTNINNNQLAYTLYTSGSTGNPKGVEIEHKSLVNYIKWFNNEFSTELKLPFISELGFDAFIKQVFNPLSTGNKIILFSEEEILEIDRLVRKLIDDHFNALNCVPSLWEAIYQEVHTQEKLVEELNGCLKVLFIGGEEISPSLLRNTKKIFPELKIVNLYGPTELTANATYAELEFEGMITIGRPVANMEVYVLTEDLELAGIDRIGELYVAGKGVARGYVNAPRITAANFIPNPYSNIQGDRLYKTGDMVKVRPNGKLVFVGRQDAQIKIRGKRINLKEIESIYLNYPSLKQVVVIARGEKEKLLTAVYVTNEDSVGVDELKEHAQQLLPSYMVPQTFVPVDSIPVHKNGKVDYLTLEEQLKNITVREYVAPQSQTEEVVCQIWGNVLKIEKVGIHDNFYELGGHSLNATQLVSRLRRIYKIDIPILVVFESETVHQLCRIMETFIDEGESMEEISAAYLKEKVPSQV